MEEKITSDAQVKKDQEAKRLHEATNFSEETRRRLLALVLERVA